MPTLGMHIIAGRGDANELDRCLESIRGPLFDQVVVGINGDDQAVFQVAKKHGVQIAEFGPWREDFAAARNHALDHLKTDYAFWVDSDDIIKTDDYQKLLELKKELGKHEVVWLMYVYSRDEHGNPDNTLPRERIFPNNGAFRWQNAIHECVYPEGIVSHFEDRITIHHYQRPGVNNMPRNLHILEKEWSKPDCSERMRFYYARDLLSSGNWAKGEIVALKCVDESLIHGEAKASLCRLLAAQYYAKACDTNLSHEKREAYRDLVNRYCLIGINDYCRMAELWTFLGCVAYDRKDEDKAILYFETAIGCLKEAYSGSRSPFYAEVPARNLFMIYYYREDFAKALVYNKVVIERDPSDAQARANRELVWKQYFNKYPAPILPATAAAHGIRLPGADGIKIPAVSPSVAWLIPWLNMDDPATRIRRVNVAQKLDEMGISSTVVHSYHNQPLGDTLKEIRGAAVCVFTQFTDKDLELMAAVKKAGKKVILDSCEAIFGIPGQREAWSLADRVVCCSTKLAEMHKEKGLDKVAVIRDAVEIGVK